MPPVLPSGRGIAATIGDIDAAGDETQLRAGVDAALAAVAAELRAHTPVPALAAAWSEVLRHGLASAVRLVPAPAEWTWFVSGSVARGEAAPGSDVETMVVLGDAVDDDGKAELLARAADVHALLERCGIRGDANGVLASRPRFCRRAGSWAEGIERWTVDPREDRGVVMTGLLADSAGVTATADMGEDALRSQNLAAVGRSYAVRQALLQDATAVRASLPSRLRMFATHSDTVDLKLAAVDPVVKIARWAALSAGSDALSTLGRLDDAVAGKVLDGDDVSSLRDCFGWLLRFRWRTRAGAFLDGRRVDDVVSLTEMPPSERAMLRSVAREVSGIGRKLNYLASTSTFR
ncbi:putative nucleotidyltransferase substrate binding domain-containing protein [Mycobacterium sp. URHB0044]|uniref:putative nucleotidyltransferase substrate binding domain-containing protein n=1 Tax=Mycobacterium sp. URHB0044 TaxID=1380386 RepID=UPI00048DD553|nr:putative nucleotidyltransferase substrate binding domain-containing protein [Mycobacterium sp. URHB0044]